MRIARLAEPAVLAVILGAQALLLTRLLHSATNYDEDVYLAAVDALRHGQALGADVFAAQFPGFYDLLRGLSYVTGLSVAGIRAGLVVVALGGTVGAWLVGRRFGGPAGGLLTAALLVVAPPLDLFDGQVIADAPALALAALALGVATLAGPVAAVAAGALLACGVAVKLTALTAAPAVAWFLGRRRLAHAAAGAAAVAALFLLAHVRTLGDLWTSAVSYHENARGTRAVIPHPHRQIFDQIPHKTPFFVLALAALVLLAATRRGRASWPPWTWVALALVFLFLHEPLHYNHLIVFPYSLAIAAGATLAAVLVPAPRLAWAAVAVVLVGAFVQQVNRVDDARAGEPASNVAAARALERLTPPGARVIDDRPIVSFLAHRRVVGQLVDLAQLRFETGSLTDAKVIARLPGADAVVVSRTLRTRPRVLAALRARFRLAYDRGGVRIYLKRPRT
jgi:hypothetical protein